MRATGLALLLVGALFAPAVACLWPDWPVGPCCVGYAEHYSARTLYYFHVDRPTRELAIYLNAGTPNRCWEQAFRRWAYHVEWCQGYNRPGDGPTFPYDGCGKFVVR